MLGSMEEVRSLVYLNRRNVMARFIALTSDVFLFFSASCIALTRYSYFIEPFFLNALSPNSLFTYVLTRPSRFTACCIHLLFLAMLITIIIISQFTKAVELKQISSLVYHYET